MSIKQWHWGKLVILWAWGGLFVTLFLTQFLSQAYTDNPAVSSLSYVVSILILCALTIVTWLWLGGKEAPPPDRP